MVTALWAISAISAFASCKPILTLWLPPEWKELGKPDAGKPPVRFDEGREADGHWLCLSIRRFPPTLHISSPSTQPSAMAGPICVEFPRAEKLPWVARSESVSTLNDTLSPSYVDNCIIFCYCPRNESMCLSRIFPTPPVSRLKRIIPESTTPTKSLITRFTRYNPSNCPTAAALTKLSLFKPIQTYSNLFKPIQGKKFFQTPKSDKFQNTPNIETTPTFMLHPHGISGIPTNSFLSILLLSPKTPQGPEPVEGRG